MKFIAQKWQQNLNEKYYGKKIACFFQGLYVYVCFIWCAKLILYSKWHHCLYIAF